MTGTFEIEHPTKGDDNPLRIELHGSESDEALGEADVLVSPWMPAHGHGSEDEMATEQDAGVYTVPSVWFPMAGLWELHVDVDKDGETLDRFTVPVVVTEE